MDTVHKRLGRPVLSHLADVFCHLAALS
jgi:hypothetical protein